MPRGIYRYRRVPGKPDPRIDARPAPLRITEDDIIIQVEDDVFQIEQRVKLIKDADIDPKKKVQYLLEIKRILKTGKKITTRALNDLGYATGNRS